jgi:hypothetical protein
MLTETQKYLLTLTEKDAHQIIENAKQEAGRDGCFWKNTEAFSTYKNVIEEMRQMVRDGHSLTIENLKFIYLTNKLEYVGVRLYTGMGHYEGTM